MGVWVCVLCAWGLWVCECLSVFGVCGFVSVLACLCVCVCVRAACPCAYVNSCVFV